MYNFVEFGRNGRCLYECKLFTQLQSLLYLLVACVMPFDVCTSLPATCLGTVDVLIAWKAMSGQVCGIYECHCCPHSILRCRNVHCKSSFAMQILMNSEALASDVRCKASIFDAQGQLADFHSLHFSVNPNPPGSVRTVAVKCIPLCPFYIP